MTGVPQKQKIPVWILQVSNSGRDFFLRMKLIELPMNQNILKGNEHIWEKVGVKSCDKYIEN